MIKSLAFPLLSLSVCAIVIGGVVGLGSRPSRCALQTLTLPLPSSHRFGDDFRTLGFAFRTLGFAVRVSLPDREGRPGNWYLPTN
jgi:hypothetical protein